eukprot:scaffold107615_cov17-Tisochrysis_lutea.AAC.1
MPPWHEKTALCLKHMNAAGPLSPHYLTTIAPLEELARYVAAAPAGTVNDATNTALYHAAAAIGQARLHSLPSTQAILKAFVGDGWEQQGGPNYAVVESRGVDNNGSNGDGSN